MGLFWSMDSHPTSPGQSFHKSRDNSEPLGGSVPLCFQLRLWSSQQDWAWFGWVVLAWRGVCFLCAPLPCSLSNQSINQAILIKTKVSLRKTELKDRTSPNDMIRVPPLKYVYLVIEHSLIWANCMSCLFLKLIWGSFCLSHLRDCTILFVIVSCREKGERARWGKVEQRLR